MFTDRDATRMRPLATLRRAIDAYGGVVTAAPSGWDGWANLGQAYNIYGLTYWEFGRQDDAIGPFGEAVHAYREAARLAPETPRAVNFLAWFLAACPDPRFRDPAQAIALAETAVRLAPGVSSVWNTLGVARYRAGDLEGSLAAVRTSIRLSGGGDHTDWFFMAMVLARRGDRDAARPWFDRACRSADRTNALDGELLRFRQEASALLGPDNSPRSP